MNVIEIVSIVEFINNGKSFFAIWHSLDDVDVLLTNGKKIRIFESFEAATSFCKKLNLELNGEFTSYDFADLEEFLESGRLPECIYLNHLWNIADDFCRSLGVRFVGNDERLNFLYSKVFYGCNLPSINTSGKIYTPVWTKEEVEELKVVSTAILNLFLPYFDKI